MNSKANSTNERVPLFRRDLISRQAARGFQSCRNGIADRFHIIKADAALHRDLYRRSAADFGGISLIGVREGFYISGSFPPHATKPLTVAGIQVGNRKGSR